MELDLQGNIEQFTLPEIFQLIATSGKTGTLGIQKNDSIVMIYFEKGDIIYGFGPRQTFHMGSLLKEKGIITSEQLDIAVKSQAEYDNSKRLGEILIDFNYIDRSDLEKVINTQIEELLYSLLAWKQGTFKFYENQFPTDEEITVKVSVENVILEGLRRVDEMNMVKKTLPELSSVFIISPSQKGRQRDLMMQADEWNIMALVNGQRSLKEICELSSLEKTKTMMTLAQLKLAGLITQCETKEVSPSNDLQNMVKNLASLFEDYLTEKSTSKIKDQRISKTLVENFE